MKRTCIALLFASMSAASASAKPDLAELHDELEIMSKILHTALRQDTDRRGIRFRGIDSTYLHGQGVVFDVQTTASGWNLSFDFGDFLEDLPGLVIPPAPPHPGSSRFEIHVDEHEIEDMVEEVVREAEGLTRQLREQLHDLRDREREYAWEQREYERRRRDLEFEKRSASDDDKKQIEARSKQLEEDLAKLRKKREEVNAYAAEIEEKQQRQQQQRVAAREKEYRQFLSGFEASVGDMLCKYGAGIKALPEGENISFVLKSLGSKVSESSQDRIYVFKQVDVQACVRDKIDTNTLLERGQAYLF